MKKILILSMILLSFVGYGKIYPKGSSYTPELNMKRWDEEHKEVFYIIRFRYIDSIALTISFKYPNIHKDTNNINKLLYMLTEHCNNDLEKYRALFVWQMHHTKFNFELAEHSSLGESPYYDSIINLNHKWYYIFTQNTGVCSGRSLLFYTLCHKIGLNCEYLNNDYHSWCYIEYDKNYYMMEMSVVIYKKIDSYSFDGFMFNPYTKFSFVDHTKFWIPEKKKMLEVKSNIYSYVYESKTIKDPKCVIYRSKYSSSIIDKKYLDSEIFKKIISKKK